jgi:hypothetical protein
LTEHPLSVLQLIGEAVNMAVGHGLGLASNGAGPTSIDRASGVVKYENASWNSFQGGAITFGNVIVAGPGVLGLANPRMANTTIGNHEVSHTYQPLGPGYILLQGASLLLGGILGVVGSDTYDQIVSGFKEGTHAYDVLERGWIDVPYW